MKREIQCSALARDALAGLAPGDGLDLAFSDLAQALGDLGAPGGIVFRRIDLVVIVEAAEQIIDEAGAYLRREAQHLIPELRWIH